MIWRLDRDGRGKHATRFSLCVSNFYVIKRHYYAENSTARDRRSLWSQSLWEAKNWSHGVSKPSYITVHRLKIFGFWRTRFSHLANEIAGDDVPAKPQRTWGINFQAREALWIREHHRELKGVLFREMSRSPILRTRIENWQVTKPTAKLSSTSLMIQTLSVYRSLLLYTVWFPWRAPMKPCHYAGGFVLNPCQLFSNTL